MSKKPSATAIGLFLVVGMVLLVGGLMLFSTIKWFEEKTDYIVYFDGSVKGLSVGASVRYRGIRIGTVNNILIRHNQNSEDPAIPVLFEVNDDDLRKKMDVEPLLVGSDDAFAQRVRQGLRAQLESESMVTGVLFVSLMFLPKAPPPVFHQAEKRYREIPSVTSGMESLFETIQELDLKGIVTRVNSILTKLEGELDAAQMKQISAGIVRVLDSLHEVVDDPNIKRTVAASYGAAKELRDLSRAINKRVPVLADHVEASLVSVKSTLVEMERATADVRDTLGADSPLRSETVKSLEHLRRAVQSIEALAEFLRRYPDALVAGRKPPKRR